MSSAGRPLLDLTAKITANARAIEDYLQNNGHNPPSFVDQGQLGYPLAPELIELQETLLATATDLIHLACGPAIFYRVTALGVSAFPSHDTYMQILS